MCSFARSTAVVAVALLITASCTPTGPDYGWRLLPGQIDDGGGQTPPISLPDTLQGTASRTVVVQTWGSSSCVRAAGADVAHGDLLVTVSPIDSVATRGICTDDLATHPREVTIDFDNAGTWTVRVIGRDTSDDDAMFEMEVVVVGD